MGHPKVLFNDTDVITVHEHRLPRKTIRLYPVESRKHEGKQKNDESSLYFMYGSTNLNEKVAIAPSILLSSSGRLIQRRNYTFLGGCSLKHQARKRLSSLNPPSEPRSSSSSSSFMGSNPAQEKLTSSSSTSNDSSKSDEDHDSNDDTDFNSSDLVVALEFSSGGELDARTRMYCHFDNNPEDRKDRSVMITLKFNDIRTVIQAHGHLDRCSQFVKVDLGIGDQRGGESFAGEKRFSCVLTSTFPCKPTHPNQCIVSGRLCSISEFESAVHDYYSSSTSISSSSCQLGIAGKSYNESGKLKFLQGHIFISICSGDDLDGLTRRQSARLRAAADGVELSDFEQRLLDAERSEEDVRRGKESVIFMMSSNGEKFPCDLTTIKLKSPGLAEMIEIHGEYFHSGGQDFRVFSMNELSCEAVTALISYLNDSPLREHGISMISCHTAISLIEISRKYKINTLEKFICQLITDEKEHLWFDIKSLIKLFHLYKVDSDSIVDGEKVRYKVLQAFQMKCKDDDKDRCVERIFIEEPDVAADLLIEAFTICSKYRPKI